MDDNAPMFGEAAGMPEYMVLLFCRDLPAVGQIPKYIFALGKFVCSNVKSFVAFCAACVACS